MASGFFKRAMVYLGLVDDEYDDYDEYEPRVGRRPPPRQRVSLAAEEEDDRPRRWPRAPSGRCLAEDFPTVTPTVTPRSVVRPVAAEPGHACTWWRPCSSATPDRSPTGSWPINR